MDTATHKVSRVFSKVPEATVYFWIAKVLTTGMGETTSDYLVKKFNPAFPVIGAFLVLAVVLVMQFSTRRYNPWIYWLTVVMVSIFGTMAADVLHVVIGVPYIASAISFSIILALIFGFWYAKEKTLSIHSVTTRRREMFYWAAVLATFALGTATGDLTATTLHLGYLSSGILFAIIIAVPTVAYWKFRMNAIFAFWFAYILTRPLGASFADWAGVPAWRGGLGLGTGAVSLVLGLVIFGVVAYLAATHEDVISKLQ